MYGKTYKTVRFDYQSGTAQNSSVYDETNGLLIYGSFSSDSPISAARQLSMYKFISMRTLDIPWKDAVNPQWAAGTGTLTFGGTLSVHMQGSPVFPMQCSITALSRKAVSRNSAA